MEDPLVVALESRIRIVGYCVRSAPTLSSFAQGADIIPAPCPSRPTPWLPAACRPKTITAAELIGPPTQLVPSANRSNCCSLMRFSLHRRIPLIVKCFSGAFQVGHHIGLLPLAVCCRLRLPAAFVNHHLGQQSRASAVRAFRRLCADNVTHVVALSSDLFRPGMLGAVDLSGAGN